jgi:hypothetical protein
MRTLLTIFFGVALSCQAATIFSVDIISPMSGLPGDVVTFSGTVTNTDSFNDEYINSDSFSADPGLTLDDSLFLANAPWFLTPGATSSVFDFFTITISPSLAPGTYTGLFWPLGGADGGSGEGNNVLGTGAFTVNVLGTPEPSTIALFLGGAALLIARRRKR